MPASPNRPPNSRHNRIRHKGSGATQQATEGGPTWLRAFVLLISLPDAPVSRKTTGFPVQTGTTEVQTGMTSFQTGTIHPGTGTTLPPAATVRTGTRTSSLQAGGFLRRRGTDLPVIGTFPRWEGMFLSWGGTFLPRAGVFSLQPFVSIRADSWARVFHGGIEPEPAAPFDFGVGVVYITCVGLVE